MNNFNKKTKIVCTIGPASDTYEKFNELVDAGMNIMRINCSHGDYVSHKAKIDLVRRIEKERKIYISVMFDTKGPEIRTGLMENDKVLIENESTVRVAMTPVLGTKNKISVSYKELYDDVKIGDALKIDDGNLLLEIVDKDEKNRELVTVAKNAHLLKNRKGVNAPFARLSMPFISEQDEKDLKFGCEHGVNIVATSFTRRADDVIAIKKLLEKYHRPDIAVIAKIENPEGIQEIDKIIEVSDGIMIARGDLGVEIPPELVPIYQKEIIDKCRIAGKPVITATQMLDSMQTHPRPTRAEVSDVATAVAEGTDCIMLSAESASGLYPREAVEMQAKISNTMEQYLDYERLAKEAYDTSEKNNNDAIANSVANTALLIGAKLIFSFTETGKSSFRIAKARPCCPIISISNRKESVMKSTLFWGIYSYYVKTTMPDFIEEMEVLALKIAHEMKLTPGTPLILTGGTPTGTGKTNFMRIIYVNEVKDIK